MMLKYGKARPLQLVQMWLRMVGPASCRVGLFTLVAGPMGGLIGDLALNTLK